MAVVRGLMWGPLTHVVVRVLACAAKVRWSRGGFGPAAAFVVAIVWFVGVLWWGLLGWQPLPVARAPFEPESLVVS
jgi:hypothetical protein